MNQIITISTGQLLLALVFILIAQASSFIYHLGLNREITIGTIRTFAQLFLMGYVLTFIRVLRRLRIGMINARTLKINPILSL